MYAHKMRVIVEPSVDITVRLPSDFPSGLAEVIVLSEEVAASVPRPPAVDQTRAALLEKLERRFPQDPALGRIVFHADPTEPFDESDWPESRCSVSREEWYRRD